MIFMFWLFWAAWPIGLAAQDTTIIHCYHEEVFENFCPTCVDQISYEIFTGITVEQPDTTYRIYAPYRVFDEDDYTVIMDRNSDLVYIDLDHTIYSDKENLADAIAACLADTSGASGTTVVVSFAGDIITVTVNGVTDTATISGTGGECPCCEILYNDSDTAAYYQNRIGKDEYYLSGSDHLEGIPKGIYRIVPENYGWKIFTADSINYGFNGLAVQSKETTRVGFDAAFLPACRLEAPDTDVPYYESETAAIAGGMSATQTFQHTMNNLYGMPKSMLNKIDE